MNSAREHVAVPRALVERAWKYGHDIVKPGVRSPGSLAVSGDRGTENDPAIQAQGKIGECAFAILFGFDPLVALSWDPAKADEGWDVTLRDDRLVDVKTTDRPSKKLIWSRTVNDLYFRKRFDLLASVTIDPLHLTQCWVEGWVAKEDFFARKKIADGLNSRLEPGTWFMDKADLWPIRRLTPANEFEAAFAPRPMGPAALKAFAVVATSPPPSPAVIEAVRAADTGWRRAFRYAYAEAAP